MVLTCLPATLHGTLLVRFIMPLPTKSHSSSPWELTATLKATHIACFLSGPVALLRRAAATMAALACGVANQGRETGSSGVKQRKASHECATSPNKPFSSCS